MVGVMRKGERKTHCHRGHEFTEANTYLGKHGRECRECRKAASSRARTKARAGTRDLCSCGRSKPKKKRVCRRCWVRSSLNKHRQTQRPTFLPSGTTLCTECYGGPGECGCAL